MLSDFFRQLKNNIKSSDRIKSNCVQEGTDGKNFEFLIPSFGLREHCHGYAGHTKGHIWGHDLWTSVGS